ncbi:hypothetical protein SANTM175S_00960 [Streptomyces antimycoticus]
MSRPLFESWAPAAGCCAACGSPAGGWEPLRGSANRVGSYPPRDGPAAPADRPGCWAPSAASGGSGGGWGGGTGAAGTCGGRRR